MKACILLLISAGQHRDAIKKIKKINGVKRAFFTAGRWDGVVQVDVGSLQELGKISMKVATTKGVRGSETLVGF